MYNATKPSFFFILRSGRLRRLQVCPLWAHQRGASLSVSESPGEPRLHEGGPEGEGAVVGGAETQTFNRRALLQTDVLKSKKKLQETLSVCQGLLFSLRTVSSLMISCCYVYLIIWSHGACVPMLLIQPCIHNPPCIPHSDFASSAELLYPSKQHLYYSKRTS